MNRLLLTALLLLGCSSDDTESVKPTEIATLWVDIEGSSGSATLSAAPEYQWSIDGNVTTIYGSKYLPSIETKSVSFASGSPGQYGLTAIFRNGAGTVVSSVRRSFWPTTTETVKAKITCGTFSCW